MEGLHKQSAICGNPCIRDWYREVTIMLIYEYECDECKDKFEIMRSISDDDRDVECPKCKAKNPKRSISLFSSSGNMESGCAPAPSGG